MIKEHYSILFCSLTGNTKKLADAIYETLPKDKCDYFGTNDSQVPQSDVCYIGFWTDKGNADQKTLELLSKLKIKRFSCLEQLDLAEVMPILKRFSDKSNSRSMLAIRSSVSICARERCHSLCANGI